jgi:tRNA dimethylallyltransferase
MITKLNTAIHRFAKKQMTFFRNMEKNGIKINWIPEGNWESALKIIKA